MALFQNKSNKNIAQDMSRKNYGTARAKKNNFEKMTGFSRFATRSSSSDKKNFSKTNIPKAKKSSLFSKRKIKNLFVRLVNKISNFESLPESYSSGFLISIPTMILVSIGTVCVISATSVLTIQASDSVINVFLRPTVFFCAGILVYFVARSFSVEFYKKYATHFLIGCLLLQIATVIIGESTGGNTNWLSFGGITIQASEFSKFALILYLSLAFNSDKFDEVDLRKLFMYKQIVPFAWKKITEYLLPLCLAFTIVMSKDMGTFMIIAGFVFVMMFVSGINIKYLLGTIAVGAVLAFLAILASPSRFFRVTSFLFGTGEVSARDSQGLQSIWGLASGGLTGLGAGASREKWGYLPAARTDFIYSIIGEEFGLFGTLLIIILFILLAYGIFVLMFTHNDPFVKLASAGICSWIIIQAIVNICVVIGFIPILGVPLPLISSGGSSLVTTMAALGFCVRASREKTGMTEKYRKLVKRGKAIPVYQMRDNNKISTDYKRPSTPKFYRGGK